MNIAADNRQLSRRGFTLVELLVAIVVIGVLTGLLITGLNAAGVFARKSASQQTVVSLETGITQFESMFGFLPPLAYDGKEFGDSAHIGRGLVWQQFPAGWIGQEPSGVSTSRQPVVIVENPQAGRRYFANVHMPGDPAAQQFLRGLAVASYQDSRYSKFSLPYYLTGVLGAQVDGIEGTGMVEPARDGSWNGVGQAIGNTRKPVEAFVDAASESARVSPNYFDLLEWEEHHGAPPSAAEIAEMRALPNRLAITDSNGKAFRYYQWLHDENPRDSSELNIPVVLLDPLTVQAAISNPSTDVTEGGTDLRSATWAIVGAGADGLFGTEEIATLRDRLNLPASMSEFQVRQKAMQDNLVRVGR
ncbi:MAG: type II secretion system protein [Leptolyngbya sp. PLA3]|nr:MAG: type II secretion system protein [Cyanobacteria bacterium CYA]MCE7967560.1 type II secretion system protein [Leptolyngbya sp. PL-A3]